MRRLNLFRAVAALPVLVPLLTAPAPGAAAANPGPPAADGYHPLYLREDGAAAPEALSDLAAGLRAAVRPGRSHLVVLVHGFATDSREAARDYATVARRLAEASPDTGLESVVVGVHWPSDVGPLRAWMPRAAGHRVAALLGFRKAVRNPYLEKTRLGRSAGRAGLRALLFRLRDDFPGTPVHVLAHSMGSQVVTAALEPGAFPPAHGEPEAVEPERTPGLDLAVLAGADLDHDVFARPVAPARRALRRAAVWWITVPAEGRADGVLELRRGAGQAEAVGNRGLTLLPEDRDALLSRRGLVLDQGDVPVRHTLLGYFNPRRLAALATSMLYLQDPEEPAARRSVLAALDRLPRTEAATAAEPAVATAAAASLRLYAEWRRNPGAGRLGALRVVAGERRAPSSGRLAGFAEPQPAP